MDTKPSFNFDHANLADQITCVGCLEHIFMHACKSASVSEGDDAVFYQTIAEMAKDFRRKFMREHFPDVKETDWCLLKAADALRQRVYECANTSHQDLTDVNNLWSTVMEHIFGVDLSGCVACREDKGEEEKPEGIPLKDRPSMEIQIGDGVRTIYPAEE